MAADLYTVIWKESKLLFAGAGGRGRYVPLVLVALFGIILPLRAGEQWVGQPIGVGISLMIPLVLVASWAADTFAGERERHTLETLLATRLSDRTILFGKIVTITGYAWLLGIGSMILGLVTINVAHPSGHLLLYPADLLFGSSVLSLLLALLVAAIGVLISLRAASVRQVQQMVSIGILLLVWVPILAIQALPAELRQSLGSALASGNVTVLALAVGGALLVIDAILLALATARFQRARLTFS